MVAILPVAGLGAAVPRSVRFGANLPSCEEKYVTPEATTAVKLVRSSPKIASYPPAPAAPRAR